MKEILKHLRQEKGITQRDLAKQLNISPSTIAMYETGQRKPDSDMLEAIADYFNVSIDYLLGRTDIKNPPNETELPLEFTTPEEAMKFILEQNVIMGFGGFDVNKMNDEEVIDFANELLNQLRILSYKYKK